MADSADTALSTSEFFAKLDGYRDRIPLDELTAFMAQLDLSLDDVRDVARFRDKTYQRNIWRSGSAYQALILCWKNGQRSPIHDHRGSTCGVRVIHGVATETEFELSADGRVHAAGSRELQKGQICGSQDADTHQMSNLQPDGADLVTLHIYSPPLLTMGTYLLTSDEVGEFSDPVR